jgi:hypothetical protein
MTTAFQPNAFQLGAFQIEPVHSTDAFQRCAFQSPGFQTSECKKSDGRSGYWRLFFYQLQEASLRARDEKLKVPKDVQEYSEVILHTKEKPKKAQDKPKQAMEYPPEDILPAPKLPRPIEVVDNTPLMARVWKITSDLRLARLTRPGKISSTLVNEEAVDDEEDTWLLLLAA